MKFSFVIPVYKTERYLRQCLDGILAQTSDDYEVVVVDDCSPGNCREIVSSYGNRFRYVRHETNRSVFQARRTGVLNAHGEFILQVDPDDTVKPGLLSSLLACLRRAPDADIVCYGTETVDKGVVAPCRKTLPVKPVSGTDFLEMLIEGSVGWALWGKAIRASRFREALDGLSVDDHFYLNNTDDLCHLLPIVMVSNRIEFVHQVGYQNHVNADSMTHDIFSSEKLRRSAKGSVVSTEKAAAFAHARGLNGELVRRIRSMRHWTMEWLLDEIRPFSDAFWNDCVNVLVEVYGIDAVLKAERRRHAPFMTRFVPRPGLFPKPEPRPVERIGIICMRNVRGGAERATYLWARQMLLLGKSIVWFCDAFAERETRERMAEDGFSFEVVPLDNWHEELRFATLRAGIEKHNLDVCLLPDHWRSFIFGDLLAVKAAGCRAVVAEHNAFLFPLEAQDFELYRARRNLYRIADAVTALSPENVAWWRADGFSNVVYMPNYLTFEPGSGHTAERAHTGNELLYVGRVCERKGAHLVLEAAALARTECDVGDLRLTYLGRFDTPEFEQRLKALAAKLNMTDRVTFVGQIRDSEVAPYYRKAKIHVLGSRIEGAPMVIQEAKSQAVPTVTFQMPYVEGLDEAHGVVTVPYGDVRAMAKAIAGLLTDDARYAVLAKNAVDSLAACRDSAVTARWREFWSFLECGELPADGWCDFVNAERMLALTMRGLGEAMMPLCELNAELRELKNGLNEIRESRAYALSLKLKSFFGCVRRILGR